MLVLTRKLGEQLMIGKDIIVQVRRIAGNRVKIGIQAPAQIQILRGETADAIKKMKATP